MSRKFCCRVLATMQSSVSDEDSSDSHCTRVIETALDITPTMLKIERANIIF